MGEEQIIRDVVNLMYGNDVSYKDQDMDTIKQINKEKDEKADEIFHQINHVCERIESELKAALSGEDLNLGVIVRANVIETIQSEVERGNNILNSNGEINIDKLYDSVLNKKDKMLKAIDSEKDEKQNGNIVETEIVKNKDEGLKEENIKKRIEELDLGLTEEEEERLEKMLLDIEKLMKEYYSLIENEKLTHDEAMQKILKGKTQKEIKEISKAIETYIAFKVAEKENNRQVSKDNETSRDEEDSKSEVTQKNAIFGSNKDNVDSKENEPTKDNIEDVGEVSKRFLISNVRYNQDGLSDDYEKMPESIVRAGAKAGCNVLLNMLNSVNALGKEIDEKGITLENSENGVEYTIPVPEDSIPEVEFTRLSELIEEKEEYIPEGLIEEAFLKMGEVLVGPNDIIKKFEENTIEKFMEDIRENEKDVSESADRRDATDNNDVFLNIPNVLTTFQIDQEELEKDFDYICEKLKLPSKESPTIQKQDTNER